MLPLRFQNSSLLKKLNVNQYQRKINVKKYQTQYHLKNTWRQSVFTLTNHPPTIHF